MSPGGLTLAYAFIALGFLLLALELFLPTSGTLFALSVAAMVVGVVMTFYWGSDPLVGLLTLLGVFIALPVVGGLLLHYWPQTRMGRRMILSAPQDDATVASMPVNLELEQLRGRFGRTVSDLRPSGIVDFDGRRVDSITEGIMIAPGHWVRCIDVRAGKVLVRPAERPSLGDLESADFTK